MDFMMSFGLASIMLCIGMIIRAKVPFIGKMLVPASVIAGVIGFAVINSSFLQNTDTSIFTNIVQQLFTISFISIGLTSNPKSKTQNENSNLKNAVKGSFAMGTVWSLLYAITPIIGAIVIMLVGKPFGMDPIYGMLIPFAFAQGPGQASTFGAIFEQYGWTDAAMVGVTFAAVGFLVAFLVGVPLARLGIKRGLANNSNKMNQLAERGYYDKTDERSSMGSETTFSGNIDTMAFHFALIGISYVMAVTLSKLLAYIPGVGTTISGMLFMLGMLSAYLLKFILKKLSIDHLIDNRFQSKITGWSADYLVVSSFMAVQLSVVGKWLIPIIIEALVITVVIVFVSLYFGRRIGGDNDFERTLGLFGTSTGTVPSGIALVRIVDPALRTTTAVELGMMNIPMFFSMGTVTTLLTIGAGTLPTNLGVLVLLIPVPILLIILKISKVWNKPSYSFDLNSSNESNDIATETL